MTEESRAPTEPGLDLAEAVHRGVAIIRGRGWPVMFLGPLSLGLRLIPDGFVRFAAILLACFLWAGGYSIALRALRGWPTTPARLLDGFRRDRRVMLAYVQVGWPVLLGLGVMTGSLLLWGAAGAFGIHLLDLPARIAMIGTGLYLASCVLVAPQLTLALCAAMDDVPENGVAIFRFTWELLRRNRIRTTAAFIALSGLSQLAWFLAPVGLLFTVPLSVAIGSAMYEQLRVLASAPGAADAIVATAARDAAETSPVDALNHPEARA